VRTIKIYATGSATGNNVANVTIPSSCTLKGIQYAIDFDAVADNGNFALEISLASATEIAVNAAQQCVAEWRGYNNLVTSGMTLASLVGFFPLSEGLKQGQILYLHAVIGATLTYRFTGVLWLSK